MDEIAKAKRALKAMQPSKKMQKKTAESVITALLPEINEAMGRGVPADEVLRVVSEVLGRRLPKATFDSVLCRVRAAEGQPKVKRGAASA